MLQMRKSLSRNTMKRQRPPRLITWTVSPETHSPTINKEQEREGWLPNLLTHTHTHTLTWTHPHKTNINALACPDELWEQTSSGRSEWIMEHIWSCQTNTMTRTPLPECSLNNTRLCHSGFNDNKTNKLHWRCCSLWALILFNRAILSCFTSCFPSRPCVFLLRRTAAVGEFL